MSKGAIDLDNGASLEIDISAKNLVDSYGIDEAAANRIIADMPDMAKDWVKFADIDDKEAKDETPPAPQPATPPPEGKQEWADFLKKLTAALGKADLSTDQKTNIIEAITVDDLGILISDIQNGITVDKEFTKTLKTILRVAKIATPDEIKIMEAIAVDEDEWAAIRVDETDGDKPISIDQDFSGKLKRILSRADASKANRLTIMEAVSIDEKPPEKDDTASKPAATDEIKEVFRDSLVLDFVQDTVVVEDGKLTADAVAAASMVQDYSGVMILKCPDELKLAVDHAKRLPITDRHPTEGIVKNQAEIKGWTSELTWNDDKKRIECSVEITDGVLIKKIPDGSTDVSIGFFCDLDTTPGSFKDAEGKDVEFDAVQRNMVLNHLAAGVPQGRCPAGMCGINQDEMLADQPNTDTDHGTPEHAMEHFKISKEDWEKLSEEEKTEFIEKLPAEESTDAEVLQHEALLKEKVEALKALGTELANNASTMTPDEIRARVNQMTDIAWRIEEVTSVINTKNIDVSDELLKSAKDYVAKAKGIMTDAMTPKEDLAFYRKRIDDEKATIIDSIMDLKPPKPRKHFEKMNIIAVQDMLDIMKQTKPSEKMDYSDSKRLGQDALDDAYADKFGS